jgi:P4 family phage/plasmid primase-like protien
MTTQQKALPSDEELKRWQQALHKEPTCLRFLHDERGLDDETIDGARLGWSKNRYTIPVFDVDKQLVNVRHYGPGAPAKMTSVRGHGSPRLYVPYHSPSDSSMVLITEGELDCLKAGQELDDVWCVSGTGGAGAPPSITELEPLRGRDVVIAYDCDKAGRAGSRKLAGWLETVAATVAILDLGLGEGEDVTDWFIKHKRSADELREVIHAAPRLETAPPSDRRDVEELMTIAVSRKVDELGSRNQGGFWLACQLRDEKYKRQESEPILLRYAESVRYLKPDPYTDREVLASLASAYAGVPRDAVGTVGAAYGFDDIGNAERLTDRHGADMRYTGAYGGWHVWDGRRWALDEIGQVERWAKETARAMRQEAATLVDKDDTKDKDRGKRLFGHAFASSSASRLGAMQRLAQSERDRGHNNITAPASAFDADPRVLVVGNGTLDLGQRVTLREHRRSDMARRLTPVRFHPEAPAPEWERFLKQTLPDPAVRAYVRRVAGYSALMGSNPERLFMVLRGPTSSGKTTVGEVLLQVMDEYAGPFELSMLRAKQTEAPRADLVSAFSKRLLFTTEASQEWTLHADHIKRLTGDDSIKVRNGHSNAWVVGVPAFTMWVATNNPPQITGADAALWARLVVVPFDVSFLGREDKTLRERILRNEKEGVLRWLADGWNDYMQHGLSDQPEAVVAATMAFRESLTPVDEWLTECADCEATAVSQFSELWDSFRTWMTESELPDRKRMTMQEFMGALDARGFKPDPKRRRVPGSASDRKVAYRHGLRLSGEAHRVRRGDRS